MGFMKAVISGRFQKKGREFPAQKWKQSEVEC